LPFDELATVVALRTGSTSSAAETTALRVLGGSLCTAVMTESASVYARSTWVRGCNGA
jgi:hypothetical protein